MPGTPLEKSPDCPVSPFAPCSTTTISGWFPSRRTRADGGITAPVICRVRAGAVLPLLGLPLKEIRELVVEAATPEQITAVLMKQREVFCRQLNEIQSYIGLIDATIAGVGSGGGFPSEKLIRLITGLNRNAVFEYRHVRFSEQTKELLTEEYGDGESALAVYWQWKAAVLECVSLILGGVEPRSEAGKQFARKWLAMIERLTQGRSELLAAHKASYDNRTEWPEEDRRLMELADPFIDEAVAYYLESAGSDGEDERRA